MTFCMVCPLLYFVVYPIQTQTSSNILSLPWQLFVWFIIKLFTTEGVKFFLNDLKNNLNLFLLAIIELRLCSQIKFITVLQSLMLNKYSRYKLEIVKDLNNFEMTLFFVFFFSKVECPYLHPRLVISSPSQVCGTVPLPHVLWAFLPNWYFYLHSVIMY